MGDNWSDANWKIVRTNPFVQSGIENTKVFMYIKFHDSIYCKINKFYIKYIKNLRLIEMKSYKLINVIEIRGNV